MRRGSGLLFVGHPVYTTFTSIDSIDFWWHEKLDV